MSLWRRQQTQHDSVGTSSSSGSNGSGKSSISSRKPVFSGFVLKIDENEPSHPKPSTLRKMKSMEQPPPPPPLPPPPPPAVKELPPPPAPIELPRELPPPPVVYDVAIVGAGPAGLMLASNLVRFGINVVIVDNRPDRTITGRADTLQPKTIETLRQMRLADQLLLKGVKVHDMRLWSSTPDQTLRRLHRDVQFPSDLVDTIDAYQLNAHQGILEDTFLRDMAERGLEVHRNLTFVDYHTTPDDASIRVVCEAGVTSDRVTFNARYLVGSDGAHSNVRKTMGSRLVGTANGEIWGVIDGVLETNFPDVYSKCVIHSKENGTIVLLPRERNMTRIYVELKTDIGDRASKLELSQEYVMQRATEILEPYSLQWRSIEWFGRYQIGRKIASKFQDDGGFSRVFITGDAAHTFSPKSQGMNDSMHDSWNLAWKLNLAIRGLAKPTLLASYEEERKQVAEDLVDYDHEHLDALVTGNSDDFAENHLRNARIISGFGADYAPSPVIVPQKGSLLGNLRVGSTVPPAKVTRFIDVNPVDIQLDIPMLGQFRLIFLTKTLQQSRDFLDTVSKHALTGGPTSLLGRATLAANASYSAQPPMASPSDEFVRPERYTPLSGLFSFALMLRMAPDDVELADLPPLWRESPWTVYLDNVPHLDTRGLSCADKWLGGCGGSEVAVVVIRPDGYVGSVWRGRGTREHAARACASLDAYFEGFLDV